LSIEAATLSGALLSILGGANREVAKCELHPLIHTRLEFAPVQNVGKKKAESKTPHLLNLNQDIVAWSQEEKCGLKYVMFTQSRNSTKL